MPFSEKIISRATESAPTPRTATDTDSATPMSSFMASTIFISETMLTSRMARSASRLATSSPRSNNRQVGRSGASKPRTSPAASATRRTVSTKACRSGSSRAFTRSKERNVSATARAARMGTMAVTKPTQIAPTAFCSRVGSATSGARRSTRLASTVAAP